MEVIEKLLKMCGQTDEAKIKDLFEIVIVDEKGTKYKTMVQKIIIKSGSNENISIKVIDGDKFRIVRAGGASYFGIKPINAMAIEIFPLGEHIEE